MVRIRRQSVPIVVALLLALVTALVMAMVQVPSATAADGADRTADYVTNVDFERTSGKAASEPLSADESISLKIDFSAEKYQNDPDKSVKPGDYLLFQLPGWLQTVSEPVNLANDTGDVLLECEKASGDKAVKCVFTDYVREHSQDVRGEYTMLVYGVEGQEFNPRTFEIGPRAGL